MKVLIAINLLISVAITLAIIAWLYPLNNGAIGLIFLLANAVSVILINILRFIFARLSKGASNEKDTAVPD